MNLFDKLRNVFHKSSPASLPRTRVAPTTVKQQRAVEAKIAVNVGDQKLQQLLDDLDMSTGEVDWVEVGAEIQARGLQRDSALWAAIARRSWDGVRPALHRALEVEESAEATEAPSARTELPDAATAPPSATEDGEWPYGRTINDEDVVSDNTSVAVDAPYHPLHVQDGAIWDAPQPVASTVAEDPGARVEGLDAAPARQVDLDEEGPYSQSALPDEDPVDERVSDNDSIAVDASQAEMGEVEPGSDDERVSNNNNVDAEASMDADEWAASEDPYIKSPRQIKDGPVVASAVAPVVAPAVAPVVAPAVAPAVTSSAPKKPFVADVIDAIPPGVQPEEVIGSKHEGRYANEDKVATFSKSFGETAAKGGGVARTAYLGPEERARFEITAKKVDDGSIVLVDASGKQLDTSEGRSTLIGAPRGRFIFVLSTTGKLYLADASHEANARTDAHRADGGRDDILFHHTSMLAGGEVLAAGELSIKDGKLVALSNNSGHYQMGIESNIQAMAKLQELGIDTSALRVDTVRRDGRDTVTAKATGRVVLESGGNTSLLLGHSKVMGAISQPETARGKGAALLLQHAAPQIVSDANDAVGELGPLLESTTAAPEVVTDGREVLQKLIACIARHGETQGSDKHALVELATSLRTAQRYIAHFDMLRANAPFADADAR